MGVKMMRVRGFTVGLTLVLAASAAACSSSTAPSDGSSTSTGTPAGTGGSGNVSNSSNNSTTITASSTTTGGYYGSGGNYFFSPTPDTVAAGTPVSYVFGSVTHNVHFSVANAPDSIPATSNTTVMRTFMTPGTYTYECLIHHFSGVIVVK
jgi:plastocyanin